MKVILMGAGSLAISVADWFLNNDQFELVKIVPVIPEPTWKKSLVQWAQKNNVSYIKSGNYEDIQNVKDEDWEMDLVFSVFYNKIIKDWFIQKCEKILNLHNGPLPKYRGVLPINWALKNNEKMHGVTIHEITKGIDDGPIVAKLEYSIYPYFDEVENVYNRSLEYGWVLFKETMNVLYKIKPEPQDHSISTYFSRKDDDLLGDRLSYNRNVDKNSK